MRRCVIREQGILDCPATDNEQLTIEWMEYLRYRAPFRSVIDPIILVKDLGQYIRGRIY